MFIMKTNVSLVDYWDVYICSIQFQNQSNALVTYPYKQLATLYGIFHDKIVTESWKMVPNHTFLFITVTRTMFSAYVIL